MKLFKKSNSCENVLDNDQKSSKSKTGKQKVIRKCDIGVPKDFVKLSPEFLPHFNTTKNVTQTAFVNPECSRSSQLEDQLKIDQKNDIKSSGVLKMSAEYVPHFTKKSKSSSNVPKQMSDTSTQVEIKNTIKKSFSSATIDRFPKRHKVRHESENSEFVKLSPEYLPHFRKSNSSCDKLDAVPTYSNCKKKCKTPSYDSYSLDRSLLKATSKSKNVKYVMKSDLSGTEEFLKVSAEFLPHFRKSSNSLNEITDTIPENKNKTSTNTENMFGDISGFIPASKILDSYSLHYQSKHHTTLRDSSISNIPITSPDLSSNNDILTLSRNIDCFDDTLGVNSNRNVVSTMMPALTPTVVSNVENDTPINIRIMLHAANQMSSKSSRSRKVC